MAERADAIVSAISASEDLPNPTRNQGHLRLANVLLAVGDRIDAAVLLREVARNPDRAGVLPEELTRELVVVGEAGTAKTVVADTAELAAKRQAISGMLRGAIKIGDLDLGLDVLREARRQPQEGTFDPFAAQASELAMALANVGRYREALEAFPTDAPYFQSRELPSLATRVCKADPSLADEAGSLLARAALRAADGHQFVVPPPANEIKAYAACKGENAARKLVAAMPPDIADKLTVGISSTALPIEEPGVLAEEALTNSRNGDPSTADRLFAKATAKLKAGNSGRGDSTEHRRRFDASVQQVAVALRQASRSDLASRLVGQLSTSEQLPILFTLTADAARAGNDVTPFLDAIDTIFADQPAFIQVKADSIRALRQALPLGSPVYPRIEKWLDKIPPGPSPGTRPNGIARGLSGPASTRPLDAILVAAEKAAPSIATVRRALTAARRGDITPAIAEARSLNLTPREVAARDLVLDFLGALPPDLAALSPNLNGIGLMKTAAAPPTDDLLVAVEQIAATARNISGARDAFNALSPDSPIRSYGAAILALGEARAGLPREAELDAKGVSEAGIRLAVFTAIVTVRPSQ